LHIFDDIHLEAFVPLFAKHFLPTTLKGLYQTRSRAEVGLLCIVLFLLAALRSNGGVAAKGPGAYARMKWMF
jgi:hypothetical protein